MGLLTGKTALIFGLANERSIAWGIAKALAKEGATLGFSYAGPAIERHARPLVESIGSTFFEPCDVGSDAEIKRVAEKTAAAFGKIDILIHSIAFANREELEGDYLCTTRSGFHLAMDISVYSFTALAQAFQPLFQPGSSLLTMTYYGAEKVMPNYNVMGVAKAALEASTRYLAADFGPSGIRVNAISAGPIRTLAAAGISGFKGMYRKFSEVAPLRQGINIDDVGATAVYLCSDMASKVTGQIIFVDSGYNILGAIDPYDCP
jgi:enoyl-[acyl-carrier protein] reductase I